MKTISDSTIKNILITALTAMILVVGLLALSVWSAGGAVLVGGRITTVFYYPQPMGPSTPWSTYCPIQPATPANCPIGELMTRAIDPYYQFNTLADVIVYSPQSAVKYTSILIPKFSKQCANPMPGAFFIGRGDPTFPGQTALLMEFVGCSR
ncbi:hypothetical protein COT95_02450 [Candidatus Falkowbacteria bacterium CG10_big_fil_rev_8_21_14_0_10_37_6]|uniref:Uncharacterized protein n=1 Tax=Candidatus Falkowbacteria bacterium CG10_big_fil_rev_8_21_14_0_10_37_6 TaxID=1974563 RepID=A0A2H0V6P1_9BACT|nr:MAG: hypothetical protein COT95_02450 [Candidatus Falkowbacteria bacterium CG10_big_fil_rev_8_21_14_0_10_37_6]